MNPAREGTLNAERSVLGALLVKHETWSDVADLVRAEHFVGEGHALIFTMIAEHAGREAAHDAVTLGDYLESHGMQGLVAVSYLYGLANGSWSAANIRAYAQIVVDAWLERSVRDLGATLLHGEGTGPELADQAATALGKLVTTHQTGGLVDARGGIKEWHRELNARYERGEAITGLHTPWTEVNKFTHGLQPGNLIVLAARPQVGKTALALNLATSVALRGKRVAVFELEMSRSELMQRCVSSIGEIPHDYLMAPGAEENREIGDSYWPRITGAVDRLYDSGLLIDDTPALEVEQIVARAKRAHMQKPLSLIVVDHLQLVRLRMGRNDTTSRAIGNVTGALKALAKQLNIPVLLLSQLNRDLERRSDKRPNLADLRESGSIEQDADLVIFLHREDLHDADSHMAGAVELIFGKGRNLPAHHRVLLLNRLSEMRLEDWRGSWPKPKAKEAEEQKGFKKLSNLAPPAKAAA